MAFLVTPGQWGDAPQMIEVLERVRVPRPQGGRPRTRPDHLGGDKAYSSRRNRLPAKTADQAHHPRAEGPAGQPQTARQQRRPPHRLRQRDLQAPQRGRADDQPAQELPGRRHPLRQEGLHLPWHRRGRGDSALAQALTIKVRQQRRRHRTTCGSESGGHKDPRPHEGEDASDHSARGDAAGP